MRERNYRNLKVWSAAHAFAVVVYAANRGFPGEERFGLTAQLRRAASSVAANLAEGSGRSSDAGFAHYVEVAYASASEAEYHLLLARDVGCLDAESHGRPHARADELRRMLAALRRTLRMHDDANRCSLRRAFR